MGRTSWQRPFHSTIKKKCTASNDPSLRKPTNRREPKKKENQSLPTKRKARLVVRLMVEINRAALLYIMCKATHKHFLCLSSNLIVPVNNSGLRSLTIHSRTNIGI